MPVDDQDTHLPERAPTLSECVVDLTHIAPVRKQVLQGLSGRGGRLVSLSEEGRQSLAFRLGLFFSR